jgi:two-component system, NtrC family, nitrogen regulation sensor histidine kinase NtrY
MKHRLRLATWVIVLLFLVTLVIWQGSFTFGDLGPTTAEQTYIFWGLSTLIFLLTVVLGFMLFRHAVKLYIDRRSNREGSRIQTKIVVGALVLTFLPTFFLVIWSVEVLNRNLDKWFSRPAVNVKENLTEIAKVLRRQSELSGQTVAHWLADSEELRTFLVTGTRPGEFFVSICEREDVTEAFIRRPDGGVIAICRDTEKATTPELVSSTPLQSGGEVVVRTQIPLDLSRSEQEIQRQVKEYDQLAVNKRETRTFYLLLLLLITLFILFVATWVALFLARQISVPISALVRAAGEVRSGNLAHRVKVKAIDEMAMLVRSFNEMTQDLEANRGELERRRRFIEAVLESIPTGVISLSYDGRIQLGNRALDQIFPAAQLRQASRLSDLVGPETQAEFSRLMKRARRTGVATREMDLATDEGNRHLSVTVSSLAEKVTAGFVIVLEDTSELLRAQKAAAWHEVARRIAHEIKNPLTPIALCSERMARQLDRMSGPPEVRRIMEECAGTISREVESVKNLVDEFSQFARFPAAQPVPGDLNAIVEEGLAVFAGRLDGIEIRRELAGDLPLVLVDREQFKRVVVNLVDNAAEAMQEIPLKRLYVSTQLASPESVELVIADTGPGISPEDKEKLFLPYFSTKQRGTGLGLAIVSHILSEHRAEIRVEDNQPSGARFIIELPAVTSEPEPSRDREGAVPA